METYEEERRQQRRLDVLQAARLTTSAGAEFGCEIRNYCLGGMFLRLDAEQLDQAGIQNLQVGETIGVGFTPAVSPGDRAIRLDARLVRRSQDGLGIAFFGTQLEATRALNKVAASLRTRHVIGKAYRGQDSKQLQDTCRVLLAPMLQEALNEFYVLIADRLVAASLQLTNFAERNDMATAFGSLRVQESAALQAVGSHAEAAFARFLGRKGARDKPVAAGKSALSIVQTDEFEDWLNLTTEINKLESHFSIELAALAPRIERLFGRTFDRSSNPFAPSVIELVAQAVKGDLNLSLNVRRVVYSTLREAMLHPLGELYKQLDGILPEGDASAQSPGDVWDATQALDADNSPDTALFSYSQPAGDASAAPETANATSRAMTGVSGTLMNLFQRTRQAEPPPATEAAVQSGTAARDGTPPTAAGGMAHSAQGTARPEAVRRIVEELAEDGRIAQGQAAAAQGSAEVFGMLADTIENDKSLPAPVRHYVRQLEETLLKLAALDDDFLNSPQHPAQRVLNVVDRLSMVSSDDGRISDHKLLQMIQRWADRIRNEADRNPDIYEEACQQLEKVLRPLMRMRNLQIARLQAGLEGWQKMGQANRLISRELDKRIADRDVPDLLLEFLNPGWRNYLIRVILRNGVGSREETEAWQAVDRLLVWMNPQRSEQPAFRDVQALLTYIDSKLTLVSAGKDIQESIVERLADGLFYPERGTFRMLSGVSVRNRHAIQEPPLSDEEATLLGQVRVGDWFTFADAEAPLNLIWIGDDPCLYVFSNYKGLRKQELKRTDFLGLLKSGKAQRTSNLDLPLLDRSFTSMIEHMHRNLVKQAVNDPETGLMRRPEFFRRVKQVWLHVQGETGGCIMGVIDIDDLRIVQARIEADGYRELMRALGQHLDRKCSHDGGAIARTGERTFAFVRACSSEEAAQSLAESFITSINQFSFGWQGETITVNANSGLAWSAAYVEPEDLYKRADAACLAAKHEGRNQLVFSQSDADTRKGYAGLAYWAGRFNTILDSDRLFLRCQPIVPLEGKAGVASHYEVLLGAHAEDGEPINIGDFVAAIERLKRITELDQWVVRKVFEWIRVHRQVFERIGAFAINLSGQSVNSKSFMAFMEDELGRGDIPGEKIIFEITESAAIESLTNAEQFIKKFRRYGCRFALDDFGVGFSSFGYLKNLKVDYLKIDGSFIRDMADNEVDVALVSSMHETSRFLGIKTVAECVENQATLDRLLEIGVNYVQGYFTGKPFVLDRLAG